MKASRKRFQNHFRVPFTSELHIHLSSPEYDVHVRLKTTTGEAIDKQSKQENNIIQ